MPEWMIMGGVTEIRAAVDGHHPSAARDVGGAVTCLAVDIVYDSSGRISRVHLGDAALHAGAQLDH